MAGPVTEVAYFNIKPDYHDLDKPLEPDNTSFNKRLAFVLSRPGAQRAYFGYEKENPTRVRLFVEWDSLEAHINFTKDESYGPFLESLGPAIDGDVSLYHINLSPHGAETVLTSPATEVLTVWLDSSATAAQQEAFATEMTKFLDVISKNAKGCRGITCGWFVEDSVPVGVAGKEGQTGKAWMSVIGWDSYEAHMAFREEQVFKDGIVPVRSAAGLLGMSVVHYPGKVLS